MAQVKRFRASKRPEAEPIPFEIETHRDDESGDVDVHAFAALGTLDARIFLALGSAIRYDDHGDQQVDMNAIMSFFRACLPRPDFVRLQALLDDPNVYIDFADLAAVYQWLVSEYNARPTQLRRSSTSGPPSNGSSSTVAPLLVESTPSD